MSGKLMAHHEEFVKLWNDEGTLVKDIAERFGVSTGYVSQYAKIHREECPKRYGNENDDLVAKKVRKNKVNREEFVELWNSGMPIGMMAKHFGVCKQYISKYAKKNSEICLKRKCGVKKKIDSSVVLAMLDKGLGIRKIAKILGVSHAGISKRLREDYGIVIPNSNRKIEFEKFKVMWNGGAKVEEIAKRFRVSKKYVYNYVGAHKGMGLVRRIHEK